MLCQSLLLAQCPDCSTSNIIIHFLNLSFLYFTITFFLALDNLRSVEYLYIYEIVGMAIHVNNIFTSLSNLSIPLRDVLRFPGTAEKAVEIIQD